MLALRGLYTSGFKKLGSSPHLLLLLVPSDGNDRRDWCQTEAEIEDCCTKVEEKALQKRAGGQCLPQESKKTGISSWLPTLWHLWDHFINEMCSVPVTQP